MITDNGGEFRGQNLKQLCDSFGILKIPIAAYHPESNGVCERVIGTVKSQLEKTNDILYAVYNYNHSIHSVTKRMPISLLYGIQPKTLNEVPIREDTINIMRQDAIENISRHKLINKALQDQRQSCNKDFNVNDIVRIKVIIDNKPGWSDPVPIITCNKATKTVTVRCRNRIYTRHFNEM